MDESCVEIKAVKWPTEVENVKKEKLSLASGSPFRGLEPHLMLPEKEMVLLKAWIIAQGDSESPFSQLFSFP